MKPKTIETETIYQGKVFDVRKDTVREEDNEYVREIVEHQGSAVIVPVFSDHTIALVRQYRHPAEKHLYELPAGTLENDEDPKQGARRELEEEIGVRAEKIEKLTEFWVSPGFLTEKMYVFLARELSETEQNLDDDESIEIETFTFAEAFEMISENRIEDAKTMVGLMMAGAKFGFVYQ